MTNPPNRVGAIRGPNGATLDDVVAGLVAVRDEVTSVRLALGPALELITTGIATTNATLTTILTRLTYVSGSVAPNATTARTSLYDYLVRTIGPANQVSVTGQGDVLDLMNLFATEVIRTNNFLSGTAAQPPELGDRLLSIQQVIEELGVLVGVGGTGGIDSNLFALLRSIDGATARSAACCENANGEPPPPGGLNPAPDTVCTAGEGFSAKTRCTGWNIRETNIAGLDTWFATWPDLGPNVGSVADINPLWDNPGLRNINQAGTVNYCFSWNFAAGQIPAQLGIVYQPPGGTWGSSDSVFTLPGPSFPIGNTVEEMPFNATIGFIARTVAGSGPPTNNAFWSVAVPD